MLHCYNHDDYGDDYSGENGDDSGDCVCSHGMSQPLRAALCMPVYSGPGPNMSNLCTIPV